jgi:hypothetical protein
MGTWASFHFGPRWCLINSDLVRDPSGLIVNFAMTYTFCSELNPPNPPYQGELGTLILFTR